MKLPSPWHANASVCAQAFIKPVAVRQSGLRRNRDVRSLQPLRTFDHIELHLSAFLKRAKAAGLNRAEVDEHILAPFSRDEAKAFRIVEPLAGSGLRNSRKGPGNPSTGKLFREIYSLLEGTTESVRCACG
jgi:hypothetical protein